MQNFEEYLEALKAKNDIEELVAQDQPLRVSGPRYRRGTQRDSLVVDLKKQIYYWHSQGESGDVIEWVMRRRGFDFKTAVEDLAHRAGMQPPEWRDEDLTQRLAVRAKYDALTVAARFYVKKLRKHPAVQRYCSGRGWSDETVRDAGIGFWDGDKQGLLGELRMHDIDVNSEVVRALLKIPAGMLIYAHVEWGKVVYVSGRLAATIREDEGEAFVVWSALTDQETRLPFGEDREAAHKQARKLAKRHYNPPVDLIGERRPYWNDCAIPGQGDITVVEGQGDAVSLAQLGIPAVAIGGVNFEHTAEGRRLLLLLSKHTHIFAGLDRDDAGIAGVRALADALGPLIRVVRWPDHDVNDWLINAPDEATEAAAADLLAKATPYVLVWAEHVGTLPHHEKPKPLDELMGAVGRRMSEAEQSVYRKPIADAAQISVGTFDKLLASKKGADDEEDEDDEHLPGYVTVGGFVEDHLLEMLYVPPDLQPANAVALEGGKTLFAIKYPDGRIETAMHFDYAGYRFYPLSAEMPILREGVVVFPPRVGKLLTAPELVQKIRELIHKYVDIDEFYETLSAYYVLFSWFYDLFPTLSYLRVIGDAGSGKTRFLEVVGSLCYRPTIMNAGASVSAIFRIMDIVRGTLVLDEGDFAKSDESADIAKLLNVGNQRRQGRISRSGSKETGFETEFYNVYGPKVISTRKTYQDNAIESRCLTKEMGAPTSRTDIPRNLPDTFWTEEVAEIQLLLLRYRLEHWDPEINAKQLPVDIQIEPRLQQVTDSLKKMIADPQMLAELRAFIHQYNRSMISKRGLQTEAKVLEALYILWETQQDVEQEERDFSMGSLAEVANDLIDYENETPIHQWSRYKDKEKHRALSSRGVGSYLNNLQLRTERSPTDRRRRHHVIWEQDRIEGLWQRYGLVGRGERQQLMETHFEIQRQVEERDRQLNGGFVR